MSYQGWVCFGVTESVEVSLYFFAQLLPQGSILSVRVKSEERIVIPCGRCPK